MKKKVSRKNKKNVLQSQKDRLRGLIGEARGFVNHKDRQEKKRDLFDSKFNQSLFEARELLPPDSQESYLAWADKMITELLHNKTNVSKPSLRTISFINEAEIINFKPEVTWLLARIKKESKKINVYLQLKESIQGNLLKNDFLKIIENLDHMDDYCGHSLWSLETRLGIIQYFRGLEAQKKCYSNIKNSAGAGFVRFIAYRISMRNEPAVSLPRFKQSIAALLKDYKGYRDLPCFIKYKFTGELIPNQDCALSILRFSQNFSYIDAYESLIDTSQNLFVFDKDCDLMKFLITELTQLNISDFRLDRLLGRNQSTHIDNSNIDFLENIFTHESEKKFNLFLKDVRAGKVSAFDIILLALIRNNTKVAKNSERYDTYKLLRDLTAINLRDSDFLSKLNHVEKKLLNLSTIPFCKATLDGIVILKNIDLKYNIYALKKMALNNKTNHVFNLVLTDNLLEENIQKLDANKFPNVDIVLKFLHGSPSSNNESFSVEHNTVLNLYCKMLHSYNLNDYSTCLYYISYFKENDIAVNFKRKLSSIETICFIETGKIENAISLIADNICDDSYPNEIIETGALITPKTTWPQIRKYVDDISLIILLDHLCELTASDSIATLRRTAIDNYLRLNSIEKPSEIINMYHSACSDLKKIIYFYEKICVHHVLEMCRCLKSGTSAVEKERTAILAILIQLNPKNSDLYQDEILSITSDLRIREGLKVVDESRLYVNQEGLMRWAKLEQAEDVLRYKNFVDAGIGTGEDFSEIFYLNDRSPDMEKIVLTVPDNEADELLFTLFCDLKDAFLFENEHGLNSYLSKRIRHNSIAGFLRGAVENDNLITLKDTNKKYLPNLYWKDKLGESFSVKVVEEALKSLEIFGSNFDNLTHFIRDELIQIKSQNKPDGAIVVSQEQIIILFHIARSFMKKNNFEISSWVEVAISLFWHMLDPSLKELRASLTNKYKNIFLSYFDNLKKNLVKHAGMDIRGHEIFNAINSASKELDILLDRASEWLKKGQSELSKHTYSINEIVDIAVRAALIRHKGCNISVNKSIDNSIHLRSDSLVVLSDIILIVIGNISDHSGLRESAVLDIGANFSKDRKKLAFSFRSTILSSKNNTENNGELENIRHKISSGEYLKNIAIEGKSGLIKIASIVEPHNSGHIDFGFDNLGYFYINLEIKYTGKSDLLYKKLEVSDEYLTN